MLGVDGCGLVWVGVGSVLGVDGCGLVWVWVCMDGVATDSVCG